jgi:hypothetical protein
LKENAVLSYIRKGRGGVYGKTSDKHGLSPLEAALRARKMYPSLFDCWWDKLEALDVTRMRAILDKVPPSWMSAPARDFALAYLCASRQERLKSPIAS